MQPIRRMKLTVLLACVSASVVVAPLAAQAGPVDFVRHLFHRKKPAQVQQGHVRQRVQAGIQITQPGPAPKYAFQEHPAY